MSEVAFAQTELEYPESDGQPVGETGLHVLTFHDFLGIAMATFADDPDVYVGGNQFMYWVEGDPKQAVAPDIYIVPGRPKTPPRNTWKVWEEDGLAPAFILEITSKSTRLTDLGLKRGLYEQLGVAEYVLYDG